MPVPPVPPLPLNQAAPNMGYDAAAAGSNEVPMGAMTDACKRQRDSESVVVLDDDDAGFTVVNNEPPVPPTRTGLPMTFQQGGFWRPDGAWDSIRIEYSYANQQARLPAGVGTYVDWGKTLLTMGKAKHLGITYHDYVRGAANGDAERQNYCKWIIAHYGSVYNGSPNTQGPDFAGYLMAMRIDHFLQKASGFQRTYGRVQNWE